MLDVGTNNEELLTDPYYIGLRQRRLSGAEYDELVDEFITAAREVFPGVVIQFEDFANHSAFRLLQQLSRPHLRLQRRHPGHRGGGARRHLLGPARDRRQARRPDAAVPRRRRGGDRHRRPRGLRHGWRRAYPRPRRGGATGSSIRAAWWSRSRSDLAEHKLPYAHEHAPIGDFLTAIRTLKPTAIIGVAAVGGTFTPEVLQAMAELNERPIVFALSNPTSKAECTAEEAYRHTDGRALFACGSPYDPVTLDGKTFVPRQGNNSYIFPGRRARRHRERRAAHHRRDVHGAAHTLAQLVTEADLAQGSLYPALPRIREVSAHIAAEVARVAYQRGLAAGTAPDDLLAYVKSQMYEPRYMSYA